MTERAISLDENNLSMLRDNLEKRLIQSDMRKKFLGGISEEDVSVYVGSVKHQFQLIENELNKQIIELQASNEEMRRDFEQYKQKAGEDKFKLQEALKNALADSSHNEDEFSEKDEIISKMNESFNSEINKLTQENLRLENERDELSKQLLSSGQDIETKKQLELKVGVLERQLMESKKSANSKVEGVKNEIDAIYSQLDMLKSQVGVNDSLQEQLEAERLRSEKTEKEMSRFREWVSELKDRFNTEKNRLEVQFVEIEEKHKAMQADVNGFRTNLVDFCINTGAEIDNMHTAVENTYELPGSNSVNTDD